MAALTLMMTNAGLARFSAAQLGNGTDLRIATIGITDAAIVVAPTLTALPGEFRRIATISGAQVGNNIVHLIVRDDALVEYGVRAFALYLSDGTMFAVYGQAGRIMQKATQASNLLAIDIAFPAANIASISFGDTNFLLPPATTETKGLVELATLPEAQAGTAGSLAITAAVLKSLLDTIRSGIDAVTNAVGLTSASLSALLARTITGGGLVTGGGDHTASRVLTVAAATAAEVDAGAIATKAVTPAGLVNVFASIVAKVPVARKVSTSGLATGGRALDQDFTIDVPAATADETRAGINTAKAVTPAALASFPRNLAQNGSVTIPGAGGLTLKWGRFTAAANAGTAVSFDQPFPNACFVVLAGGVTSGGVDSKDNTPAVASGSITASGFNVFSADDTADGCSFIAIGY
jgi:hypothetical protein